MKDDPIGEALRGLPRDHASPGFTARLMSRRNAGGRARRPAIYLLPAAALLLLGMGVWLGIQRVRATEAGATRQAELRAAREEAAALQAEYQRLLQLTTESPRFIHVNLAEDVDLVVDLSAWATAEHGRQNTRPAVYRPER